MIGAGETKIGSALLETTEMTPMMILSCWIFGASTLVVNVIIKQIPEEKFKFAETLDIEGIGKK